MFLTLFRMWGNPPPPLPVFLLSPVTSANVGIRPQNFLLVSYWCKISGSDLLPVPNYWTWTKTAPQKKWFFWSDLYKIEVMITSLIEMLELTNFGHMTTSTIQFDSPDNFFCWRNDRNYDIITVISKELYLKKSWCSHFCWHHQNCNHVY